MFPPFNFRFGVNNPADPRRRLIPDLFPDDNVEESNPYQFSPPVDQPQVPVQEPGFMEVYKELMNKQNGPAMAAYRKFVEAPAPTADDFQPTKTTRLGAILSGAAAGFTNPGSGFDTAQSIIDRPRQIGMRRYLDEGNRLKEAASLEETDTKNRTAAVKSVMDMRDKEADNIRQARLADSTIATNAARAKAAGNKVIHADDGHVYVFDANNQKTDLGKLSETPEEKTARAIQQAVGITEKTSPIIEGRTKRVNAANSANIEGRERRIGDIKFDQTKQLEDIRNKNRNELEDKREKGRADLTKTRLDAAQKRIDTRINQQKDPSITQKIKTNLTKAQALVDADPSLEEYWNPDSTKDPLAAPPDHNSPEFAAWKKLYDVLYDGISTNVKVTKSGNKIERQ